MKKLIVIAVFALLGVIGMFALNQTVVATLGIGIPLPFGWVEPDQQSSYDEDFTLTSVCNAMSTAPRGFPFAFSRDGSGCGRETNSLAASLNTLVGAGIGATVGWLVVRKKTGLTRRQ